MHYVYRLTSQITPSIYYVGATANLRRRMDQHNAGENTSTAKFAPWHLTGYVAFRSKLRALGFERYLKTGSGCAFGQKHLWHPSGGTHTAHYVYCLVSDQVATKHYIGCTENLRGRLQDHNARNNSSTAEFAPWSVEGYIAFKSKLRAEAFERYLKSGSGRAFAQKRLW